MKKTNKMTVVIATALLSVTVTLRAGQIHGNITIGNGTVELNTASSGTATAVTVWHGIGGVGNPKVLSRDGDYATFVATGDPVTLVAPWSFVSGPVAGYWSVGGFTFDLIESHIFSQGGNPPGAVVQGTGTITGNGFDPTFGYWSFSTQDPSAQGLFSFSAAALTVPCTGQIGDFVWNDLNGNVCQYANEPGTPGVIVDLYKNYANPVLIETTTTDNNGGYLFTGLCAGSYSVHFHTPNGFVHTTALQGCGGQPGDQHNPNDSNCDCTGADDCDVCVTLPTDNSVDLTIDCGYTGNQPCLTLLKTADSVTAPSGSQMG